MEYTKEEYQRLVIGVPSRSEFELDLMLRGLVTLIEGLYKIENYQGMQEAQLAYQVVQLIREEKEMRYEQEMQFEYWDSLGIIEWLEETEEEE